jgi:hypothetical protein
MAMDSSTRDSQQSSRGDVLGSEKGEMSPIEPRADVEQAIPPVSNSNAALDWTGPNDPDNPQNWSRWFRHYHVVPPAMISFAA